MNYSPASKGCRPAKQALKGKLLSRSILLETDSGRHWPTLIHHAVADISAGLRRYELWAFLGLREVRKQYQRSVLGPLWLTLNMGILITALGWFYSQIFAQDITTFLPYLALGFIVWALVSGLILESCAVFTSSAPSIRQVRLPFSVYAYQLVWRQLVVFGHNFLIYLGVAIVFGIWPGSVVFLGVLGLAVISIAGFFLALVLGPLSARFRDVPPIAGSFVQILFFLTPIIWTPASLPERATFVLYNPFYHFVAIVREPMLGNAPSTLNWIVALGLTALIAVFSMIFFARLRARIPYWA